MFKNILQNSFFIKAFVVVAALVFVFMAVQDQIALKERKQQILSIEEQIKYENIQNEKYKTMIAAASSPEYIERIARTYGFVMPGERVFVNTK
ncbi:MAG: septum formation initiator family protein [Oscillospiraceae bacterium]|nr:septum formation initiator family protein [Oscillospiraceae bacterium]